MMLHIVKKQNPVAFKKMSKSNVSNKNNVSLIYTIITLIRKKPKFLPTKIKDVDSVTITTGVGFHAFSPNFSTYRRIR